MIWTAVSLHRRGCREQIAVVHGIASLVDRLHDATQQQSAQIGHLLRQQASRYHCHLAMMTGAAGSLVVQVCS